MITPEMLEKMIAGKKISRADAQEALQISQRDKVDLERVLTEKNWVNAEVLTAFCAAEYGLAYINLADRKIENSVLNLVPEETSRTYGVVAFGRKENKIDLALVDPKNFKAVEAMEFLAKKNGWTLVYHMISPASFALAQKRYRVLGEEVGEVLEFAKEKYRQEEDLAEEDLDASNLEQVIKSAPVSKIVSVIIKYAVDGGASDIHIEPTAEGSKVRFRVDGILRVALVLPSYIHSAVISRIKVLANLKLDETRRPQDGRIKMRLGKLSADLRVSILPLVETEKVVMRLLDTSGVVLTLEQLGFRKKFVELIAGAIQKSHGEILVTGPTGSGKSTTLYSLLNMLNGEDVNIVTLEDPPEYFIPGINQSQVNADVGFTFASGLRSLLRQDPDVIMVGEIRDTETAELSIHAALTGHIVFSTLHTNSAIGAIPRLMDMHVEPFLISATMEAIIGQRLVRKICEHCKKPSPIPGDLMSEMIENLKILKKEDCPFDFVNTASLSFYRGTGCSKCGNSGYKGRTVIAEVLMIEGPLKDMLASSFSIEKFSNALADHGYITMKQDGFLKALEGNTTIEEVLRVMRT
ncbi:MAG: type IV pilus assembly protein PilB [Parcubacteria group bacterium Gr01-1014_18]|nr:MAG: type IV pilus assembly protein PilB [Parcubacteria group bacterium Greene0416_36]TSC80866.1 MAG: type IV pilus assembly protein PilB [Parcubacteria group bacterium Gr01-1014_18]TSC99527.1 MAG: type IV pilus assembly protein PilB [Parcubacteria group bacterium Greene1014_20]TSD07554.1 MAG: type IV pilus assembly protein PilB [Parcubacteria group bacterium Greene0714_2]